MMNFVMGLGAAALLLSSASGVSAQAAPGRVSLEVSGGAAIPAQSFGARDGADTGAGFGASLVYAFAPMFRGYLGYERESLPCDNTLCGAGGYVSQGVSAGAEVALARAGRPMSAYPWVRAGVLINTLEHEVEDGSATMSVGSERGVGFQVRAGMAVPVTPRVSLLPGVGYSLYRADFDGAEAAVANEIDVGVVEVGLSLRVGL